MKSLLMTLALLVTCVAFSYAVNIDGSDASYTTPQSAIDRTTDPQPGYWSLRTDYYSIGSGVVRTYNEYGDAAVLTTTYSMSSGTYDVYLVYASPYLWNIRAKMGGDTNLAMYDNTKDGASFYSYGGHWLEFFWESKIGQVTLASTGDIVVNIDDNAYATGTNLRDTWYDGLRIVSVSEDTTPPEVSTTTPTDNATNVALDANITINFDELMKMGSLADLSGDSSSITLGACRRTPKKSLSISQILL